jgi:hypothetical protein
MSLSSEERAKLPHRVSECKDCGQVFVTVREEQYYYMDRNLALPKRCNSCREKRKRDRESRGGTTNSINLI